jgi:ElaB/YqjD/DUF883 family membrane-anchored ribosome-binding protein
MNPTSIANQANSIIDQASNAAHQASDLAQRGTQAVREGTQELREKARSVGDSAVSYIQDEPVKAVLIAAATGATLMALLSLISRGSHRH